MGVQAIKLALADCHEPLRLAISGDDALGLALTFDHEVQADIVIVGSAIASDPATLVEYARRVC